MAKFTKKWQDVELEITTCDFAKKEYKTIKFPHNSHYLYILENGKEAYIGETNNIITRLNAYHRPKSPRYGYHFKWAHVVTGLSFDKEPALHFESMLIRLMKIDKKFDIVADDGERTIYSKKTTLSLPLTGFGLSWWKRIW